MKIEQLQRKILKISNLVKQELRLEQFGRRYRIEDNKCNAVFGKGWLSATELWDRLDFSEMMIEFMNNNFWKN